MCIRDSSDGVVVISDAKIDPFEPGAPLTAARVDGNGVSFSKMMDDLGVTPDTIVAWDLDKTRVTKIKGTLSPLRIEGDLAAETSDFEVFNRAYHDPARKHMIGVRSASIRGRFGAVSYTHLRAHETVLDIVCRLLLEKNKHTSTAIDIAV